MQDNVRRLMEKVISRNLAIHYNWAGKGQKRSFKVLLLKDIIIGKIN